MPKYPTLSNERRALAQKQFTKSLNKAKATAGAPGSGCGFCAADAIVLPQTNAVRAYNAAVDILHLGLHADILDSRRTRFRGRRLLALRTTLPMGGKRSKQFELWFDISAIEPKPEDVIEDADLLADKIAEVVYNSSLGHLLCVLDESDSHELIHHRRYNLYCSDFNAVGIMYAAIDCANAEMLNILLSRTSLSVDTCDEECTSLVHFYYKYRDDKMIAVLHRHGLADDYDPAKDDSYAYYADDGEEEEEEEEECDDDGEA